jgi:hypothetical protein
MAGVGIKVGDRMVLTTRETRDRAGEAVVTLRAVQLGVAQTADKP